MELKDLLKQHGLRRTRARTAILSALLDCCCPLTVEQLRRTIGENNFDKATIYRELSLLEGRDVICSAQLGNRAQSYELKSVDHNHHLVCLKCGTIDNFAMPNDLDKQEKAIRDQKKFDVVRHCLEFYGHCAACR